MVPVTRLTHISYVYLGSPRSNPLQSESQYTRGDTYLDDGGDDDSRHSFASNNFPDNKGFAPISYPAADDTRGGYNDSIDVSEISSNKGGLGFE
jgi:hypothetical protein